MTTDARVSDAELAALIAGLTTPPPPAQSVELLVSRPATCSGCGTTLAGVEIKYGTCPRCALKGNGDALFTPAPAAAPAPCLDAFCASGPTPCGLTPNQHLEKHGAAATLAALPAPQTAPVPASPPAPPAPVPGPTTPSWDPPPSTVAELRPILTAFDASRPRSMQVRLGPSELGTPCQQQIARKLAGAPRQPVTAPPWAPMQGTAMHTLMEDVLEFWNARLNRATDRWLAEDELAVDDEIRGHGDAFDLDHLMVVDWKYVGTTALKKLRAARRAGKPPAEQVSPEYRVQGHLYGVGHERKGRDVRFVRLVLLARSWQYDDSDEWTEAYQPDIAFAALTRYYATQDLLTALDVTRNPDFIAAVPATPSPDSCKWCPFARPGQPSDWGGCAGDVATATARVERFAEGLIAP